MGRIPSVSAEDAFGQARDRTTGITGLESDSSGQTLSDASISAPISGANPTAA
jgi:hypothetical protein